MNNKSSTHRHTSKQDGLINAEFVRSEANKFLCELAIQSIGIAAFFATPSVIILGIIAKLFASREHWLLVSVCAGVLVGFSCLFIWAYTQRTRIRSTITELKSGCVDSFSVEIQDAMYVLREDSSVETMVLDCGTECIIVSGGWWKTPSHRIGLRWNGHGNFPTSSICVEYLPRSGRVLSVAMTGQDRVVRYKDAPIPPMLRTKMEQFQELKRTEDPVKNVVDVG